MKKIIFTVTLAVTFATSVFADTFTIPHIAEKNWETKITIINPTDDDQKFTLTKYDDNGEVELTLTKTCNSKSKLVLTNDDFGYSGTALVKTTFKGRLFVKLSYRFKNSESLSEFFLDEQNYYNSSGTWIIPNPQNSSYTWFGLAIFKAVKTVTPKSIILKAYKNGELVGTKKLEFEETTKYVKLSNEIWEGVSYSDFDMVVIECDNYHYATPLAIMGNEQQDRHLFFQAVKSNLDEEATFAIPHIAESNWTTSLSFYNASEETKTVTINTWSENGEEFLLDNSLQIEPLYHITITTNDINSALPYAGNGLVTSNYINNPLLSFRYGNSESVCSFFLKEEKGTKWLITNNSASWFDWMGISLNNPYPYAIDITLDAYKDGELIRTNTFTINSHEKFVKLSNEIWDEVNYTDIDMVIVNSDYSIYQPIAIIGNNAQNRHLFYKSQNLQPTNNVIFVNKNFEGESDGTKLKPFKTITNAVSIANDGDTIKITADTYNENISTDKAVSLIGGFTNNNFIKPEENSHTIINAVSNTEDVIRIYTNTEEDYKIYFSNLDITNGKRGIYLYTYTNATISNCNIYNNGIENFDQCILGGGIYWHGSDVNLTNCNIYNNLAAVGGGIFISSWDTFINNNNIYNNSAIYKYEDENFGGGMFIKASGDCTISNNTFSDNTVGSDTKDGIGGGIAIYGEASLENNKILNNFAYFAGGGIAIIRGYNATISHSLICYNKLAETGEKGAGIFLTPETPPTFDYGIQKLSDNQKAKRVITGVILTSSTIAYNTVQNNENSKGNGIYAYADVISTGATAENCIFFGNSGNDFETNSEEGVFNINYCLTNQIIGGIGNVSGDPLFADAENYDFHLKSEAGRYDETTKAFVEDSVTSHCIDKGNPSSDYSLELKNNGNLINIGCYGNTEQASKSPEKSDEDNMIDNAFRIDIQNITVTYDVYPDTSTVNATATMTFYMRPGYKKPVFHFTPLAEGYEVSSVKLNDESLTVGDENDLKTVTFDGSTQKAIEIQRDLEENTLYTLTVEYPASYAMDNYKKMWTWTNVNDIEGTGNEYYFPTINFPSELAKHKITFNVHGGGYSFVSSGKTTENEIEDGQQFIIEPIRDVASYTIMFVLIPTDDVVVEEKEIDGVNVKIMAYQGGASISSAFDSLEWWLPKLHNELGEFPMPEGLSVFLTMSGGGMEYYGATITSLSALNHEVFHMYYGCSTINKTYRDSWLDEAINEWYEFHHSAIWESYTSNIVSGRTPIGVGFDTRAYTYGARIMGAVAEELGGVDQMVEFLNYLHNNYFFRPYTTLDFVEILKNYGNVDMYDRFIRWVFNNEPQNKSVNQVDEKHKVDMTPPKAIREKYENK